jgi:hypothetical protein
MERLWKETVAEAGVWRPGLWDTEDDDWSSNRPLPHRRSTLSLIRQDFRPTRDEFWVQALREQAAQILDDHVNHCVAHMLASGDQDDAATKTRAARSRATLREMR